MINNGYLLNPTQNLFAESLDSNHSLENTIQALMESLHARVAMNTWTDLIQVLKDGNLNLLPEKLILQPKFNGQNLDLSACKSVIGSKTLFSGCNETLLPDFKLSTLVDSETGEECTLQKNGQNILLAKGGVSIQTSLSNGIETMNTLNLGNDYTLNLNTSFIRYEFGVPVTNQRTVELNVDDSGQLLTVRGESKNPNLNFTCKKQ